ncbi:MAG: hypothetical protein GX909_02205 [Clostridiaceae bacterium]|nr:hypothetical protein [Clostridiaceae bacterium]
MNKKQVQKHNRICLLLDYYGSLLTERKQEILRLSYEEDMSLSEIADLLSITRQAVHENMQRGIEQLEEYEEKIGAAHRDILLKRKIDSLLEDEEQNNSEKLKQDLLELQKIIL